jgi:hypothetical protein
MFDNSLATDFTNAWKNCALSQQSVDNILVSLDTAGQENGIVDLNGGTSAYPSPVGIAARDNLVEKGWTVNLNTIVMQGLILNLDAGNPASYPGYGTVWNDLSGRGNDGTLVNGVSYDSANDGSLVFDGSNYASLSGFTDFEFGTGDFTLDIWFKLVTVTNDYQFLYNEAYGLSSNGLQVRFGDWGFSGRFQCGVDMSTESCWSTTHTQNDLVSQYEQVVFRRGSGVCSLWLRGSQQFLNREFFPGSGYTFTDLGNISLVDHIFFGEGLVGNVYAVKVYDRALSDSEIAQNYDALKGRFGL